MNDATPQVSPLPFGPERSTTESADEQDYVLLDDNGSELPPRNTDAEGAGEQDAPRSPLFRFFDSFLREQNIKWVLGIGALIVLASSLMLVTAHWSQQPPVWKYLIMLGYTAVVAVTGRWCHDQLGLAKTGAILRSLALLLMPVLFLALHWVQETPITTQSLTQVNPRDGPTLVNVLLLGVTTLFTVLVAPRIFRHFLRSHQPTFVAAYILLCVAGALAPLVSPAAMPFVGLLLWAIFAVGAVKVNRHVFWMIEEHRTPRIAGFLPILMLGGQFLALFILHVAPHVTLPWMGLGCVLVAAPVLMTADAVARVFQQRTGDLVRPLPLPISVPLVIGLVLTALGVVLAGSSLLQGAPAQPPFALVPTAAIAAGMMMLVARRTGKQPFVWAGLIGLTIAYRYSPVFFSELAAQLIRGGADLVHEEKLPIAFYGLTFLPLIAGLMFAAAIARRKASDVFRRPCLWYSVGLSALMLVLSLTHAKAMMPVALAMTGVFAAQVRLYRDHRLAVLAIISFIAAAIGVPPFLGAVFQVSLSSGWILLCVSGAAMLLLVPGHLIDRALTRLANASRPNALDECEYQLTESGDVEPMLPSPRIIHYCRDASMLVTMLLAAAWIVTQSGLYAVFAEPSLSFEWFAPGIAILALLATHAIRAVNRSLALATLGFAHTVLICTCVAADMTVGGIASVSILALLLQWVAGYAMRARPESLVSRVFSQANDRFTFAGLGFVTIVFILPSLLMQISTSTGAATFMPWLPCQVLVNAWLFDAARRNANGLVAGVAYAATMGLAGAVAVNVVGPAIWQWLPALWAALAVASLPIIKVLRRDNMPAGMKAIADAMDRLSIILLRAGAAVTLLDFSTPMRVTGITCLAGLLVASVMLHRRGMRSSLLLLANWHAITFLVQLTSGNFVANVLELPALAGRASLPIALAAAVSAMLWQFRKTGRNAVLNDLVSIHRTVLQALAGAAILTTLNSLDLTALDFVLAGATMITLIAAALHDACVQRSEERVWFAQTLTGLAIGYFAWHGLIGFGHGVSMFATLGAGIVLGAISHIAQKHPTISVLSRPFRRTATALPLVTVVIGIARHMIHAPAPWLGINSLAILLAGGFYFWMGAQHKDRRYTVLAAAILNIALLLLWNELSFSDPQFYLIPVGVTILSLVRVLRSEIPANLREPLNYLGALVILVSPVFHIVTGSWLHLFSLMALSVIVVLGAIGFRVRPMVYTGAAFLVADLIAMVIYGAVDNVNLLWIAGIALGAAVVTLGALAERNREALVARLRRVSAAIAAWE